MKIIGHRGGIPRKPESTIAAFAQAARLGAHGVEFDVQQCLDGELVVIHDFTLDRTTTGSGLVAGKTWAELRSLDAGSWHDPAFINERIPSLEMVLELEELDFELELKGFGDEYLGSVLSRVRQAGVLDRVEFTSSNVPLLALLKQQTPEATVGFFSQAKPPSFSDEAYEHYITGVASTAPFDVAHVHAKHISPSITARLHEQGLLVHANDATNPEDVRRALEAGADKLSTDDVAMALSVVASL